MNIITTFLPPYRHSSKKMQPKQKEMVRAKPVYYTSKFQQFSMPLAEVLHNYNKTMPPVMRHAMRYIADHESGVKLEYIFRHSPPQARLSLLKEQANKGFKPIFQNAYEASAIIKLFLREMTEPLIPSSQYQNIIDFPFNAKETTKVAIAVNIIESTPKEHNVFLWRLFKLLSHIVLFKTYNKMGSKELGDMIGSNICWAQNPTHMKAAHIAALSAFATFLIERAPSFFKYDPGKNGAWNSTIVNRTEADDDSVREEHAKSQMSQDSRKSSTAEQSLGHTVYYNVLLNGKRVFVTTAQAIRQM